MKKKIFIKAGLTFFACVFCANSCPPPLFIPFEGNVEKAHFVFIGKVEKTYVKSEKVINNFGKFTVGVIEVRVEERLLGEIKDRIIKMEYFKKKALLKFEVGRDYLFALREKSTEFIESSPCLSPDGIYLIKDKYSENDPEYYITAIFTWEKKIKITRTELERLVQNRKIELTESGQKMK